MRFSPLFADPTRRLLAWLLGINVAYPWFVVGVLWLLPHPEQRQVVFWLAVVLLFTFNQLAARHFSSARWAFWAVSTLNICATILLGGVALATVLHQIPAVIAVLFDWQQG